MEEPKVDANNIYLDVMSLIKNVAKVIDANYYPLLCVPFSEHNLDANWMITESILRPNWWAHIL